MLSDSNWLIVILDGIHLDISYMMTQLACQSTNPSKEHLEKALYMCWYLLSTSDYSLLYDGDSRKGLIACTDSDWDQDKITSHSQIDFYLKLVNEVFL